MAEKKTRRRGPKKAVAIKPQVISENISENISEDIEISDSTDDVISCSEEEPKRAVMEPIKKVESNSEKIPVAHVATSIAALETAVALKTCCKFHGNKWHHLSKGKPLVARRDVIKEFRRTGLVQ